MDTQCDGPCDCKKGDWHHHKAVRVLTAVIVVVFIFWCGFEFGEIRASVGGMHEGYRMMQSGFGGAIYNDGGVVRTQTTPTTGANVPLIPATGATTNAK